MPNAPNFTYFPKNVVEKYAKLAETGIKICQLTTLNWTRHNTVPPPGWSPLEADSSKKIWVSSKKRSDL